MSYIYRIWDVYIDSLFLFFFLKLKHGSKASYYEQLAHQLNRELLQHLQSLEIPPPRHAIATCSTDS